MKLDPFPSIYLADFLQYSSSEHRKRRPPILKYKHLAHKGHGLTIHECPANFVFAPPKRNMIYANAGLKSTRWLQSTQIIRKYLLIQAILACRFVSLFLGRAVK